MYLIMNNWTYSCASIATLCVFRYKYLNISASSRYRRYAASIPSFLINRPHDIIRHVMPRYADGQAFSPDDVLVIDNIKGVFDVASSTTVPKKYAVHFDKDGMPHCECFDWQKHHLPCKHFCAVFSKYPEFGWHALSPEYRDSVYFKLDEDVIGVHTDSKEGSGETTPDVAVTDWMQADDVLPTSDDTYLNGVTKAYLHRAASCREILCDITNLTYQVQDSEALDNLYTELVGLRHNVVQAAPAEAGILLNKAEIPKRRKKQTHITGRCIAKPRGKIVYA